MSKVKEVMDLCKYVMAGKATFTLHLAYSEKRYTYRVNQDMNNPRRFFVRVLFGADNEQDYRYIGLFYDDTLKLRVTKASSVSAAHPAVDLFDILLDEIACRDNSDQWRLEIYKSKHCARCGRLLTTPESIERGLGPECQYYAG